MVGKPRMEPSIVRIAAQAVHSYCRYKAHKVSVHRVRALHCGHSASTGWDVRPFVQWEVPPQQRVCSLVGPPSRVYSLDFAQTKHLVHPTAQKHPRPKYQLGQIDRKYQLGEIAPNHP